jgi:hypothetical protein
MNLTKRTKWLTCGAALVAAWVAFGPRDPDAVEPARAESSPSAHTARPAAAAPAPLSMTRSVLALTHRVVDQTTAASLFAAHSWYVPPPPAPTPAPVDSTPAPPPRPVAPPLPYQYIGSYTPEGQATVFFLSNGDRVYDVHVGDTLDNTYSIDSYSNGQLVFTYKPLNIQQQLIAGVGQ